MVRIILFPRVKLFFCRANKQMNDKNVCLIIHSGMVVTKFCYYNQRISQISFNRGKISSVGRALDCRAGGRGFDSRDRTNTQGLEIT